MESSRNPSAKRSLDHGSPDSPLSKRLRPEELLELLEHDAEPSSDEPDVGEERDLESVIRSFEEEIGREGEGELGFLLHASDDELGLPPPSEMPSSTAAEVEVEVEVASVSDLVEERSAAVEVGLDAGLLGWCDDGLFGPLDLSDLTWHPMPAV